MSSTTYDDLDSNSDIYEYESPRPTRHAVEKNELYCQDFKIVTRLNDGKFKVNVVFLKSDHTLQVMKIFPLKNKEPCRHFLNEIRFHNLSHPHVIAPSYYQSESLIHRDYDPSPSSIILSEYAPNSNFLEAFKTFKVYFNEKLARGYFHQLISGIEYLHSQNVAHLDIKLENLVLDQRFKLRIIDFDTSQMIGVDRLVTSRGTEEYRAPELINDTCQNLKAADIYSAGIVLFLLVTNGDFPYLENEKVKDMNLMEVMQTDKQKFWAVHEENMKTGFSKAFKELFERMVDKNPKKRATIQEIKNSLWWRGKTYSESDIEIIMKEYYEEAN